MTRRNARERRVLDPARVALTAKLAALYAAHSCDRR